MMDHGGGEHMMDSTVAEEISWSKVNVTLPARATPVMLPVDLRYAMAQAKYSAMPVVMDRASTMFPLKRRVESQSTILFGWAIDRNGAVSSIDLSGIQGQFVKAWIEGGGFSDMTPERRTFVLGLFDLTLCSPDDDFQPKNGAPTGAANVARVFPLFSLWCSDPMASAAAELTLKRPAKSMMTGMANGGVIVSSLFTDQNRGIRSIAEHMSPEVHKAIFLAGSAFGAPLLGPAISAALTKLPSPRWDSLFAHYAVDQKRSDIVCVDPTKPSRTDPSSSREVRERVGGSFAAADPPVLKVAGQGMFDNVHIAPQMIYNGSSVSMAPICHHDCLHIHWRWSLEFTDASLLGWSGGIPHSKAGAPLVPENQTLRISVDGPRIDYKPVTANAPARQWQVFMHHGAGYVTELLPPGKAARFITLSSLTPALPSFEAFYFFNRWLGTTLETRLNEAKFGALESL